MVEIDKNEFKFEQKFTIDVPKGIRYLGEWKGFSLPEGPHIIDKQIPGCGFTEYCITNKENTILCSPRRILLKNKQEQHPSDVYLIINSDLVNIDKDLDRTPNNGTGNAFLNLQQSILAKKEEEELLARAATVSDSFPGDEESSDKGNFKRFLNYIENLKSDENISDTIYTRIRSEFLKYKSEMDKQGKPYKILVTYDSFRIIKEVLRGKDFGGLFETFRVVVDEFQTIFTDSMFKSEIENLFLDNLSDVHSVCYVSATPMMEEYLAFLDHFKNLKYFVLDWKKLDPIRVVKPLIHVRTIKSISGQAREIIQDYLSGNYVSTTRPDETGQYRKIESKEAVFFVNSVKNIAQIIKSNKLSADQVNILVADTPKNKSKLRSILGSRFKIGRVPLKGEPRKQFTFCTRTVYLGADFYSDNARSFVLSDANIKTLAVDISLDLPQILGRQRLLSNPWRNEAWFYYRPLTDETKKRLDRDDFDRHILTKEDATQTYLQTFKNSQDRSAMNESALLVKISEELIKIGSIDIFYIGTRRDPVYGKILDVNYLALLAEIRAFKMQEVDYQDRFSVFSSIDQSINKCTDEKVEKEVIDFYTKHLKGVRGVETKLRALVNADLSEEALDRITCLLDEQTRQFLALGLDKLRACNCKLCEMSKLLGNKLVNLSAELINLEVGKKYFKPDLKDLLQSLYDRSGVKKVAKATDIERWYDIKYIKIKSPETGKWENGFEILGIK